jgi:outer membrane protein insertion porin family
VDVIYTVEEKPTGSLLLGAGFSTVDKLVLQGSITQANIFGSGKFIGLNVSGGTVNRTYSISYLDPYFTVDGVGQGFDLYTRKVNASTLAVGPYTTDTIGAGFKFGYPLSETDAVNFGLVVENVKLGLFDATSATPSPLSYLNFASIFGTKYTYGSGSVGWARDRRDSVILTSSGTLTRAGFELAGGDFQYYRATVGEQFFYPLSRTVTLALGGEIGYIHGISGKQIPFFKNFYAGGPGSVRGYQAYSLGEQDAAGNVLGGTRKITGSAEVLFPVPGAQQDKSLRLSTFIDAGQVYAADQKLDFGQLRYSAGVGLAWNSPFGPLKISLAQPLNAKSGFDRIERLQLNFGTAF